MTMKKHSSLRPAAAFVLLLASGIPRTPKGNAGPKVADAKPGDIRVMVTAAIRVPLDTVLAEAAKVVGHPLVVEYGSARGGLKDEILAGQAFEVAILLPDVNEDIKAKDRSWRIRYRQC